MEGKCLELQKIAGLELEERVKLDVAERSKQSLVNRKGRTRAWSATGIDEQHRN